MSSLADRVALVTGAGRGIGRAIALTLSRAGATVALAARSELELGAVQALIEQRGDSCARYRVDLADRGARAALIARIEADLGRIDVLVNNAGIAESAPFERTDDERWRRTMAINVEAPFDLTRRAAHGMRGRGWGRVVNIASTASSKGYPYVSAYVASKHALLAVTRSHAAELLPFGITVNAVCPGYTMTEIVKSSARKIAQKTGGVVEEVINRFEKQSPLGRLVDPFEVAQAVLFCVGPDSGAVNGQAIGVDGGEVMS